MKGGKQEGKDMEIIYIILHIQWYKNGTLDGDRKFNNLILCPKPFSRMTSMKMEVFQDLSYLPLRS